MKTFAILLSFTFLTFLSSSAQSDLKKSGSTFAGGCSATYTYNASGAWVDFTADVVDSTWSYDWDFGDGNTGSGSMGFNFYQASGTYNVCLTVTDTSNNCTSTFCDSITVVIPVCNSTFTYTTDSTGTYYFQAQPDTGGFQYFWDFGDGNFTQGDSAANLFQTSGSYYVCLYTNDSVNGCNSSFCDTLDVFVPVNCSATFFTFPQNGSATFIVQGMNPGMTYQFDFGDSTTGAPNNFGFVMHNYPAGGVYNVCLNVIDSASGCTSSFCDTIVVPACVISADFVVTNLPNGQIKTDALQAGFQYQFTWLILPSPDDTLVTGFGRDTLTHTFTSNGLKTVCLQVTDLLSSACRDSICKFVMVSGIGIEEYNQLNSSFSLYPNPSNELLNIRYSLDDQKTVSVTITDLTGKAVLRTENEKALAGEHTTSINIEELASGTYLLQLQAGDLTINRKFTKN